MTSKAYRETTGGGCEADAGSDGMSSAVETLKCGHCGGIHEGVRCPIIKAIEYHENGTIKRVEYLTPLDYGPQPTVALPTFYVDPRKPQYFTWCE